MVFFVASEGNQRSRSTNLCYADDDHGDANVEAALSVKKSGISKNNQCFISTNNLL